MPVYRCEDCGEVFRSKSSLSDHREDCAGEEAETPFDEMVQYVSSISFNVSVRDVQNKFTLRNMGLAFGVLMMATLFLGTASFMTSTAPSSGTPTGAATAASNPALGYSISGPQDVPRLSGAEQPGLVREQPLSIEQQLWAITQGGQQGAPGAIIHYNCESACPELVNNATRFAQQNFQGWVYVAPNPEISSRVAVTGYQRIQRYDSFQPQSVFNDVCSIYTRFQTPGPIACATGR